MSGYLLERLVGVGGMAAVFRARDERLGRVVALKLLAGDDAVRSRFVREARAVAAVDHPHIIPVYAAGEENGVLFIAMRFVAGDDLRVIVGREGGLPPRRTVAFISPVASALDAAHGAGLVHRDVKPANMLVDVGPGRPEHVYLSDFGLARGVLSTGGLTRAGQFMGTPDYAAPEQISGLPVDGRMDQYALGCVAYTLLTGTVPFRREEPMAVLYAHLSAPAPRVSAVRQDVPRAVDQVLARALAKDPEDRYDSCGDFADALREALGVESYDPSRLTRPVAHTFRNAPNLERTVTAPQAGAEIRRAAATAKLTVPPDAPGRQHVAGGSPGVPPAASAPAASAAAPPARSPAARAVQPVPPQSAAVSAGTVSAGTVSAGTGTWTAVVAADRVYYDNVQAAGDSDAKSIEFPAVVPERRVPLTGNRVRIGRRSDSHHIQPEIDLTGPPTDKGVSRLHAVLMAGPDQSWSVINPGSVNGILVNGTDVPVGEAVTLRDGDRLHLGAWTVITITRD